MTLLTICQDILKETKSSFIPNAIITNTDDVSQQILQAVKISIIELSRNYQWQELQKEYNFSSVASQEGYDLPSDFDRMINDTFWNKTQYLNLIGPTTPEKWRMLKDTVVAGTTIQNYFRIRNNQVLIHSVPTTIENYVFEYISKNIVKSATDVEQTTFLADTDLPIIDEYIVRLDATWRWLKMNGRPYAEDQNSANKAVIERIKINGSRARIVHEKKGIYNPQISAYKPIVYPS